MGCISSKFNRDDVVSRCQARKRFMKQAVMYRHSFAAAHSAYLLALRNTGAALRQFADGEGGVPATGRGPYAILPEPPPPPPLPAPSPGLENRTKASPLLSNYKKDVKGDPASEPAAASSSPRSSTDSGWDFFNPFHPTDPPLHLQENRKIRQMEEKEWNSKSENLASTEDTSEPVEGGEKEGQQAEANSGDVETAVVKWEPIQNKDEGGLDSDIGMVMRLGVRKNLLDIVKEIDDEFLQASAGGTEAARVLETRKARFQSDFSKAKHRNFHSARVFSAFSWNWSRSPLSARDTGETADETGVNGSHALTLERLLAWEKKLYDEIKLVDSLCKERDKKCSLLRRQETRGDDDNVIDRTRAHIKRLHSLISVSYQGVNSTLEAIEDLRDDELHPQLVGLIEGLRNMWETMHRCHAKQTQIVVHIKSLDAMMTQEVTTDLHHQATIQLERELTDWHESFSNLVTSHRGYMDAVHGWLRLSLIRIDTGKGKFLQEDPESLNKGGKNELEVYKVCEEWQRALSCLPDKVASEAVKCLGEVVKAMVGKQEEEVKLKKKVEKLEKQWERKINGMEESIGEQRNDIVGDEKRVATEALKKKLEVERLKYRKAVQDTRVLTMNNLQTGLPGVFEAMTGFSAVSAQAFDQLWALTRLSSSNAL